MKLYIHTAEARVARFSATENFFLEIFSQKYEVRILIFFVLLKMGNVINTKCNQLIEFIFFPTFNLKPSKNS